MIEGSTTNTPTSGSLHAELEEILKEMEKIQRSIKSVAQPASSFELDRLAELGARYGEIVESLRLSG